MKTMILRHSSIRCADILPQACGSHAGECGWHLVSFGPHRHGNRCGVSVCCSQGLGLCGQEQQVFQVGHGPRQGISGDLTHLFFSIKVTF